jgi:uncharacterized protein (TIGR02246 family)
MSDEDMLKAQTDAFTKAWAAGDSESIAALFAPEGDSVDPAGVHHHGTDAVRSRYQELFEPMYQGTSLSLITTSTRFLEPTVAVSDGTFQVTGMKGADGAELPAVNGRFTTVSVKQDGTWVIHCSRPMMPLPAPSGT